MSSFLQEICCGLKPTTQRRDRDRHTEAQLRNGLLSPLLKKKIIHGTCQGPLRLLSPSLYCLLNNRPINQETSCWGKEQRLYSESWQTEQMVDSCPKEPSCLGQNSDFFYTKRRGSKVKISWFWLASGGDVLISFSRSQVGLVRNVSCELNKGILA